MHTKGLETVLFLMVLVCLTIMSREMSDIVLIIHEV